MQCSVCNEKNNEESEIHLLHCTIIIENINIDLTNAKYENIFSDNLEEQTTITKIFNKVFKTGNSNTLIRKFIKKYISQNGIPIKFKYLKKEFFKIQISQNRNSLKFWYSMQEI